MKVTINEIYSKKMFSGLIIGKPKEGMYQKSLDEIKQFLGNDVPIINISEIKWENIQETTKNKFGYGSWGHITGINLRVRKEPNNYEFSLIFNFFPELEKLEDVIHKSINLVDYENNSLKWNDGDL